MTGTTLRINTESSIGKISPRIYGHFAEHLGRCCYDGLWLGNNPQAAEFVREGFHKEVLTALQALPVPLLRWPGGCYAEHYHWRDGIGPTGERPRRLGMSCGLQVVDDNSLGTHEFMRLCELLGAEPYLAGNLGNGSPQELCDWIEYCNSTTPTTLVQERQANGASKPFGVKLWGIGNENWGCGGNFDSVTYAHEYRRFATMIRHTDPMAELVACGYDDSWNRELLQTLGNKIDLVDHLSIHQYWIKGGPETGFNEDEYYTLLAEAATTEDFIQRTAQIIEEATGGKQRIGVALDEWGVWHPEARNWGDKSNPRTPTTYEQAGTLRDAIAAAIALEGFHRQCRVLSLANLAQVVNVLHAPVMTQGVRMWVTPTYHVLRLHASHIGATALEVEVVQGDNLADGNSAISATASRRENGSVAVTVINKHLSQVGSVRLTGLEDFAGGQGQILTAERPDAQNSLDEPERVQPAALEIHRDGNSWLVEMPPHAVATLVF
ncbi:MAG TPA: alpha-L-arabinofuranosidase C-terminal domain-containing protein [Chloroflexia bacterium]|nr:alpha-L-arabinofuranosidase C-terminal domain-containing protein [Chloroflexia bacterium]